MVERGALGGLAIARMSPSYAHRLLGVQLIPISFNGTSGALATGSRAAPLHAAIGLRDNDCCVCSRDRARYCGGVVRFLGCNFVTDDCLGGTQFNAVPSLGNITGCLVRGGALLPRG